MARVHMESLRHVPEMTPHAYADVHLPAAERFLADFGGAYATPDPYRVISDPAIDAVLVCTWHDAHRPLAEAALAAGKPVFVEKPLALTVEDCLAVEKASAAAGIPVMVGFKFRFAPLVAQARQLVPTSFLTVGQIADRRWPDQSWAQQPVTGGANILSQGVHAFDLVRFLHRRDPVRLWAAGGALTHPGSPLVDTVTVSLAFADGTAASVVVHDAGAAPVTSKFFFEMFDGEGSATLHERCHTLTMARGDVVTTWHAADRDEDARLSPEGTLQEMRAFARQARTGVADPAAPTAHDGTWATRIATRAIAAIASGQAQECGA
jgi:predicted dehydrogenase